MISRPAYWPLFVGIWMVPVLISLMVWGPDWWARLLPSPAAAVLQLREARYIDRSGCASHFRSDWQEVAAGPEAAAWFRALVEEAITPAGRAYGIIGVYGSASSAADARRDLLPWSQLLDSVPIISGNGIMPVRLDALLEPAVLDSLLSEMRDTSARPEC